MSLLVEQVVKKVKGGKETAISIITVLLSIIIPCVMTAIGMTIGQYYLAICAFFVFCFAVYFCWYIISSQNYEYEYAVLEGTLKLDKVIAKRKRKKITKLEVRDITDFKKINDLNEITKKYAKVYNLLGNEKTDDIYTAEFQNEKGHCLLIFTPNEKMLNAMRPYFKREIATKIYLGKI